MGGKDGNDNLNYNEVPHDAVSGMFNDRSTLFLSP